MSETPLPAPNAPKILLEADMWEPLTVDLPFGKAILLSVACNIQEKPNEDAAAVIPVREDCLLLAVADGMGGTRNGAEAAALVLRQLAAQILPDGDEQNVRTAILDGIETANRRILSEVADGGTTLALIELHGHRIRPYHIGDSTILVTGQKGKLKLNTVAHSPVGFAVEAGFLHVDDALHHNERHLISNALGFPGMRIELGAPLELARHDTLLIASDGLTDNVFLDEMVHIIRRGPLDKAVMRLARLARERMATPHLETPTKPDDLTLIAYRRNQ